MPNPFTLSIKIEGIYEQIAFTLTIKIEGVYEQIIRLVYHIYLVAIRQAVSCKEKGL